MWLRTELLHGGAQPSDVKTGTPTRPSVNGPLTTTPPRLQLSLPREPTEVEYRVELDRVRRSLDGDVRAIQERRRARSAHVSRTTPNAHPHTIAPRIGSARPLPTLRSAEDNRTGRADPCCRVRRNASSPTDWRGWSNDVRPLPVRHPDARSVHAPADLPRGEGRGRSRRESFRSFRTLNECPPFE